MASGSEESSPSGTPGSAPKFGTLVPNRVFVGGLPANTTEQDLRTLFSVYGAVKDTKIISDRAGVSRGYGFVTFETQDDAEKIINKEADNIIFRGRKLNIAKAMRKQQPFPRLFEPVSPGTFVVNGVPYSFHNGMAVFHSPEGYLPAQPQVSPAAAYPVVMPQQQLYAVSQAAQGYYQSPTAGGGAATLAGAAQWRPWFQQQAMASPVAATTGSPLLYQGYPAMPGEMVTYATQTAPPAYPHTDLAEAAMMEAAPAEGSMVMEPSMGQRYVEAISTVQSTTSSTSSTPSSTRSSSIVYGKRPGPAIVATPRKIMNTTGMLCSMSTPRMSTLAAANVTTVGANGSAFRLPLTPPPTPDVVSVATHLV